MRRRDGLPQWIDETGGKAVSLTRADLSAKSVGGYDEAWLQNLLHDRPEIFPIEQIEPGFGDLIPLCRELPVSFGAGRSGSLDNLYATANGGLAMIEAKLWRNPEARRSVVAQAMEYAAAVFSMSYDELERTVLKARGRNDPPAASLYELVSAKSADCEEAEFVDAVSRNLKRGRAIIAVVGDGIREDILPLAQLLQSHAGNRFTFALVELAVFETPVTGLRVVVPSVLAQTELIERGVIRIDGESGPISVSMAEPAVATVQGGSAHKFGINEDEFFEALGQSEPKAPRLLRAFLANAARLGVYVDMQRSLNLKYAPTTGEPFRLANVRRDGSVDTQLRNSFGRRDVVRGYIQTMADCIGGDIKDTPSGDWTGAVTPGGNFPRITDLLPAHEQVWLDAMARYIRDAGETADSDSV